MTTPNTFTLRPLKATSFEVTHIESFTNWLQSQGFTPIEPKNTTEQSRFVSSLGQVIVIYHTHRCLMQGKAVDQLSELLKPYTKKG